MNEVLGHTPGLHVRTQTCFVWEHCSPRPHGSLGMPQGRMQWAVVPSGMHASGAMQPELGPIVQTAP